MMRDPEPPECAGCLRKIGAPNVWLCDTCVRVAIELGYEATPYHHPGDEVTKILWNKAMERQRAETEKRRDGTGKTHREDSA